MFSLKNMTGEISSVWVIITIFIAVPQFRCSTENNDKRIELWSVRMAESVMQRRPVVYGEWDYVTGTVLKGFEQLWRRSGDQKYLTYVQNTVDSVVAEDGTIADYDLSKYNIDEIKEGSILLFLYKLSKEKKYKKAADILREQLAGQPRNSLGGFWHKKRYPYQMWLDGLYMGAPFYAEYSALFNEQDAFDDIVNQFALMEDHARDSDTGLLYHAWDEKQVQDWADPNTGLSQIFWGRAIGWFGMALVDVLDYLPPEHNGREKLVAILRRTARALSQVQDRATGVWWQVLDRPHAEGNYLEASASCMYVYTLAKGVRLGYLDEDYAAVAKRGYNGIIKEFIQEEADGTISLAQICRSAGLGYGRDGSYNYYVYQEKRVANDGKGVGPFITASIEIEMMSDRLN